ncbi:MAG: glycosyltransferase family 2 protein [Kangiellaceae bacterium]|nr:glycosyltransferase family 2 protein [Kangiellaceae bacterium]
MKKIPVSVFIITLNEEPHIARALESCGAFDELIVVDSGSTDNTVQIATSYGAKVIHNPWPGFAKQKQFAMQHCRNSWVLNLDADEELTEALIIDIKVAITTDCDYMRCYRNDLFMNSFFPNIIHKPNNHRLFKRESATYRVDDLVHEGPDFTGKEFFSKNYFNHYGYNEIKTLEDKYNYYSSLKARERFSKGKKPSFIKLITIYPLTFIKVFVLQRYVLAGLRGFIFSKLQANYAYLKQAKLFEHYQSNINKK